MRVSPNAKVLIASLSGSAIEWFDYFLYGTMSALVLGRLFFPSAEPATGVLLAYLSFSLTFFIRPLGGVVFAHFGDRFGRKRTLVVTMSLMGGATVLIGLLPTYSQIGLAAPALLVILRLVQGVGIGGEWGGALLLAYEHAPASKRSFFSAVPQAGVTVGMLLSTLCVALVSLLPEQAFVDWGWRLPFLASGILLVVGFWIRRSLGESADFVAVAAHQSPTTPILTVFRHHGGAVLVVILAKFVETAPFYIFTTFSVGYAVEVLGYHRPLALMSVTAGAFVATVMIPIWGLIADRIGRRRLFLIGAVLIGLFAVPYFQLLALKSTWGLFGAAVVAIGLLWPMVTSVLGALFSDRFPAEVRYTGVSLGYQTGAAVVGGTAPLIATYLLMRTQNDWRWIAGYIAIAAVLSALAIAWPYAKTPRPGSRAKAGGPAPGNAAA